MPKPPLAITTSDRRDPVLRERARLVAQQHSIPYLPRDHKVPLGALLEREADACLVFESSAVALCDARGTLRFSPGLAHLRIKQLDAGVREDMLLRISGITEGDHVLDCTLGLAADAQVATRLVGPSGTVVGLEKSLAICLLVRYGLKTMTPHPRCGALEVIHADAHRYLSKMAARSVDVVLIDPMFARPRKSSAAFETLRRHADYSPLTMEMLAEARRVARKAIVVKGSRYSDDFKKLGIRAEPPRPSATVLWARLEPK